MLREGDPMFITVRDLIAMLDAAVATNLLSADAFLIDDVDLYVDETALDGERPALVGTAVIGDIDPRSLDVVVNKGVYIWKDSNAVALKAMIDMPDDVEPGEPPVRVRNVGDLHRVA